MEIVGIWILQQPDAAALYVHLRSSQIMSSMVTADQVLSAAFSRAKPRPNCKVIMIQSSRQQRCACTDSLTNIRSVELKVHSMQKARQAQVKVMKFAAPMASTLQLAAKSCKKIRHPRLVKAMLQSLVNQYKSNTSRSMFSRYFRTIIQKWSPANNCKLQTTTWRM